MRDAREQRGLVVVLRGELRRGLVECARELRQLAIAALGQASRPLPGTDLACGVREPRHGRRHPPGQQPRGRERDEEARGKDPPQGLQRALRHQVLREAEMQVVARHGDVDVEAPVGKLREPHRRAGFEAGGQGVAQQAHVGVVSHVLLKMVRRVGEGDAMAFGELGGEGRAGLRGQLRPRSRGEDEKRGEVVRRALRERGQHVHEHGESRGNLEHDHPRGDGQHGAPEERPARPHAAPPPPGEKR